MSQIVAGISVVSGVATVIFGAQQTHSYFRNKAVQDTQERIEILNRVNETKTEIINLRNEIRTDIQHFEKIIIAKDETNLAKTQSMITEQIYNSYPNKTLLVGSVVSGLIVFGFERLCR